MKAVRKDGNLPRICRIDQPHKYTHGWYLRLTLRDNERTRFSAFFSDRKYGGKEEALRRATEVRDSALEEAA